MHVILWIVGIIVALGIIVSWATGRAAPPGQLGYYYLRKELKQKASMEVGRLPPGCVEELVALAAEEAAATTKLTGEGFQFEFVKNLDVIVDVIILRAASVPSARAIPRAFTATKLYVEILDKFNVLPRDLE